MLRVSDWYNASAGARYGVRSARIKAKAGTYESVLFTSHATLSDRDVAGFAGLLGGISREGVNKQPPMHLPTAE